VEEYPFYTLNHCPLTKSSILRSVFTHQLTLLCDLQCGYQFQLNFIFTQWYSAITCNYDYCTVHDNITTVFSQQLSHRKYFQTLCHIKSIRSCSSHNNSSLWVPPTYIHSYEHYIADSQTLSACSWQNCSQHNRYAASAVSSELGGMGVYCWFGANTYKVAGITGWEEVAVSSVLLYIIIFCYYYSLILCYFVCRAIWRRKAVQAFLSTLQ
jgi:hypothetical protein